jgi:transcriptional regulator with XRE-family HTH domain
MTLGERIHAARKKTGKTQRELALAVERGSQTIWRYEADWTQPDIATLKRIAEVLGVPVTDFLDDTPAPESAIEGAPDAAE